MINIFRKTAESKVIVTQSLTADTAAFIDEKIWRDLCDKLVDLWVKKYGTALLKEITPKEMKQAVRKQLEDKIAARVLNL